MPTSLPVDLCFGIGIDNECAFEGVLGSTRGALLRPIGGLGGYSPIKRAVFRPVKVVSFLVKYVLA